MDPFAILGLPHHFDLDRKETERRYRSLQKELHPDRHTKAPAAQRRVTLLRAMEVNEAYRVLCEDVSRGEALLKHHAKDGNVASGDSDPMFLMEVMELREALGEAKAGRDGERVEVLARSVRASQAQTREVVSSRFLQLDCPDATEAELKSVQDGIGKLKYYKRFLDEVQVIEDLLLDSI